MLTRLALLVAPTGLVLGGLFFIPPTNLEGTSARMAHAFAQSGGALGLPLLLAAGFAVLLSRPGPKPRELAGEGLAALLILATVLGGMAWVNEHALKPALAIPRPNLVALADAGELGGSVEAFYALGDKEARSAALARRFTDGSIRSVRLHPRVRAHWIAETGFSFPSGHATAALTSAVFLVGWCLMVGLRGWRRGLLLLFLPWAWAVCASRPWLRVHSPLDVLVGAVQGVLLGGLGLYVLRSWRVRRVKGSSENH